VSIDRLGQLGLPQEHVQLGAQAQEVDGVARVQALALDAGGECLHLVAGLHQRVHGQEGIALVERTPDALEQAVGGERLEDIVGRGELGRADHLAVVAFCCDHEEHRGQAHQLVVAQVFQQLLAILAAFEIVLAQDEVELAQTEVLDRLVGRAGVLDPGQAAQREHAVDAGAHSCMGLDDQGRQAFQFVHCGP